MLDLPIDHIPGSDPPKFKWRMVLDTPSGPSVIRCDGTMPRSAERAIVEVIQLAKTLHARLMGPDGAMEVIARAGTDLNKLRAFKDWVEAFVEKNGVPANPVGDYSGEGGKLGDRLEWLVRMLSNSSAEDALQAQIDALKDELAEARKAVVSLKGRKG